MSFAPNNKYTAYDVLSMSRHLAKAEGVEDVLNKQGQLFYQMSLLEIVTLLNGALDKAYSTYIEAFHQAATDDDTGITTPQYTLKAEDDIVLGSTYTNFIDINIRQMRVTGATTTGVLYNPFYAKEISRITSIEQRIDGAGALFSALDTAFKCKGALVPIDQKIKFQSILDLSFPSGQFEKDLIWCEFGGKDVIPVVTYNASPATAWASADANSPELPSTGTVATDKFPGYFIRIKKANNNSNFVIRGSFTSNTNYYRPVYAIWYQRLPNMPVSPLTGATAATDGWRQDSTHKSRWVDLPIEHMPLLMKRIYTHCLLQLNKNIPQQLSSDMMNDYQKIYAFMDAEQKSRYGGQMQQIENQLRGQ